MFSLFNNKIVIWFDENLKIVLRFTEWYGHHIIVAFVYIFLTQWMWFKICFLFSIWIIGLVVVQRCDCFQRHCVQGWNHFGNICLINKLPRLININTIIVTIVSLVCKLGSPSVPIKNVLFKCEINIVSLRLFIFVVNQFQSVPFQQWVDPQEVES